MDRTDRIRILADDLTGALDTAAAFCGDVPVFIDTPPDVNSPYRRATVSVVATPTRDVPAETLPTHLAPTLNWFTAGTLAYKKVDSLLRGNTFAEIAWLQTHGGFAGTIFAPAFPAQGRITTNDRQWVIKNGEDMQPVARPLQPAFAELGAATCPSYESCGTLPAVWIPEVRDDGDLDRIAALLDAATSTYLWSGSAGLAHAIARRRGLVPGSGTTTSPVRRDGPTVLISASFQPTLYAQWDALKAALPTPAIAERARPEEIAHALALTQKGAKQVRFDLSPRKAMTQEESMRLLQRNISQLVDGLPKPGQVMIVGGDTLLGLCRTTGAGALLASASIRAGWGCARLIGGCWDGVYCYSRSGAFGGPDDLIEMMRLLPQ